MALKIQNPRIHDNTDGDLIIINKTKLSNHLYLIQKFYFSSGTILGWLGLTVSFGVSAFIAENFKNFGIKGETWRAVFVLLAFVAFGFFIYNLQNWVRFRKKHNPEILVNNLLDKIPHELRGIQFIKTEKGKKR